MLARRDDEPGAIRALQLLLRLERTAVPSWHRALAMAATACAALCLDVRSEPGGEWYDAVAGYTAGHIRKVTRRARGAQWDATATLPGLSMTDGDTQIRAILPGPVQDVDNGSASSRSAVPTCRSTTRRRMSPGRSCGSGYPPNRP